MFEIYYENTKLGIGTSAALYILMIALVALIVLLAVFLGKNKKADHTKAIVYAAVSIALAFGLSYAKIFSLPLGGSVTLASLLPLMLYSYMFGIRRGVIAGFIYGFLQFVQEPYFFHPAQFLLDYPLAFAAVGLAGLFHDLKLFEKIKVLQFVLGAILAVTVRYLAHTVSGIFVFGSGDPENYNAVAWSFLYNSFAFADLAVDLVAGAAMFSSRALVRIFDAASGEPRLRLNKAPAEEIPTVEVPAAAEEIPAVETPATEAEASEAVTKAAIETPTESLAVETPTDNINDTN